MLTVKSGLDLFKISWEWSGGSFFFSVGFGNWFGNQEEMIPCLQEQLRLSPRVGANVSPSMSVSCLVLHLIHFTLSLPLILHFIPVLAEYIRVLILASFCCSNLCRPRPRGVCR